MQIRQFQNSDMPRVIALISLVREADKLTGVNEEETNHLFSAPHLKAEENFFVALDEQEIIGFALQMLRPNTGLVIADLTIHPDYRETEAAQLLLAQSEKRALERLPQEPNVYMILPAPNRKVYLRPILYLAEYEEIRRTYEMRIELDEPLAPVVFPEAYTLRPFALEDGQAVFSAFLESFAEHFGEVSKIPYEQWSHQFGSPHFDPSLWHILYHGEEIAAICLCETSDKETGLGLVETLGVRPKFRRQGLAALLLRHAFQQFQARGFAAVALDVDADNSTNAVALYQSVGMTIQEVTPAYHKVLRG